MMQVSAYGRLGQAPREISTRSGKAMVVGSLACDIGDSSDDGDAAPLWLGLVCFGGLAEKLLKHEKGAPLSVSGRLQRRTYTDRNGEQREQLQCVCDALVSARTSRPSGGKRKAKPDEGEPAPGGEPEAEAAPANDGEPFDDDITF